MVMDRQPDKRPALTNPGTNTDEWNRFEALRTRYQALHTEDDAPQVAARMGFAVYRRADMLRGEAHGDPAEMRKLIRHNRDKRFGPSNEDLSYINSRNDGGNGEVR